MKKVKEFKDAGLEFVDGDICFNESYEFTGYWFKLTNDGDCDWLDDEIKEFAWRENTGERPSFSGVVEVVFRDGDTDKDTVNSFYWEIHGGAVDIIKWRPVINEESKIEGKTNNPKASERKDIPECNPEIKIISNASDCDVTIGKPESEFDIIMDGEKIGVSCAFNVKSAMAEFQPSKQGPIPGDRQRFNGKECELTNVEVGCQTWTPIEDLKQEPVFTKEMHEAGELPPVGSMFTVEPNAHLAMECLYSSKFCVIGLLDSGLECVFDLHRQDVKYEFKPIDTRTYEEKLVDEAMRIIDAEPGDSISPEKLVYMMIKAGYRKP